MPVDDVGKKIFIDGAGTTARPEVQQGLQTLNTLVAAQRCLVSWKAANQTQRLDARKDTILGCLGPYICRCEFRAAGCMFLDQVCRTSGKRLLRQKILHRLPEEDWRMKTTASLPTRPC